MINSSYELESNQAQNYIRLYEPIMINSSYEPIMISLSYEPIVIKSESNQTIITLY